MSWQAILRHVLNGLNSVLQKRTGLHLDLGNDSESERPHRSVSEGWKQAISAESDAIHTH
jgi:hypothetical protein